MPGESSKKPTSPETACNRFETCQQLAQTVREDIRLVLASSWELQQLNCTAPRISQAKLNNLALPRKARMQQQVTHGLHDVCDFARWKAEQLAKKRAVRQAADTEQQLLRTAHKEALQGWWREQQQLEHELNLVYQEEMKQQRERAKQSANEATQRAKQDLQLLKEKQQKQKLHAAELHTQLAKKKMDTTLVTSSVVQL